MAAERTHVVIEPQLVLHRVIQAFTGIHQKQAARPEGAVCFSFGGQGIGKKSQNTSKAVQKSSVNSL